MKRDRKPEPAPLTVASAWPDTMGLEQAAEYLRLGRDATRDLIDQGLLAATSLNQKHMVLRRVTLDAFLASTEQRQTRERASQAAALEAANDAERRLPAKPRRLTHAKPDLRRYEAVAANEPSPEPRS